MNTTIFNKLQSLFNKAEEGSNDANLQALENCSTKAPQALKHPEAKLQFTRVKTYIQHGEISNAYVVARTIQKTPSIREESIQLIRFLMKEKRYSDVIEMCNIFKPVIVDQDQFTTEGKYKEIVEFRQKAMDKLEEYGRFDMMRLPHEILTLILDQLDFIDIVNCIHVSKDWRYCICNDSANNKYHVVLDRKTRQQAGSFSSNFFKSSIRLLSDGVKGLKIDKCHWEEDTTMEIFDMLKSMSFNNLRVLNIDGVMYSGNFQHEELRNLLQNSSHSLEEVYLKHNVFTCNEILNICPNLKRLRCETPDAPPPQQPQTQYLPLTYLHIQARGVSQTKDFEQALKRLTNLEELTISRPCIYLTTLRSIHQYGSKQLRHICINTSTLDETDFLIGSYKNTYIDTSRFDYTVDVHDWDKVTATSLLQLINHSANMKQKIKALSLSLGDFSRLEDWDSFKYFTSPCLQFLRFSFTEKTEGIFATVIRNCPTLQEISIFRLLWSPSYITLNALKTLPALQCFAIENAKSKLSPEKYHPYVLMSDPYCFPSNYLYVDDTIIREFFTYHVLLGNRSTLQEVRLRYIGSFETETFKTLFKIKSLKSLNFAGSFVYTSIQGFGSAINGTKGCLLPSQLERLVLEDMFRVSDYDLQFLDFPTITLAELSGLTILGFQNMMNKAGKLKKLIVLDCEELQVKKKELEDTARRNNISLELL